MGSARDPCGGNLRTTHLSLRGLVKGDSHSCSTHDWGSKFRQFRAFGNRQEYHKIGIAREMYPWMQYQRPLACLFCPVAVMVVARGQKEDKMILEKPGL